MRVLWYVFALSLRRLWRRRVQNGLMLGTFTVSIGLSLLSCSLFYTIFIHNPEFDPRGELCIVTYAGAIPEGSRWHRSTRSDIETWQASQKVFTNLTGLELYHSLFLPTGTGSERVLGANLSAEALSMVGAKPLLGRLFTAQEDKVGCAPVAILSYRTWQDRYDGNPKIIGQVIKVNEKGATVVGVMPREFRFPNDQAIWLPLGFLGDYNDYAMLDVLARLKPGVSRERAAEDLRIIQVQRGAASEAVRSGLRPYVMPFREFYLNSQIRISALVLFALSLLFVAISCSNAANLMLIDFFGRTSELASSFALGVPRRAAIRAVCFQVFIIATIAALISIGALLLAAPFLHGALALMNAPYWLKFSFEVHHLLMAVVLTLVSAGVAVSAPIAYLVLVSPERIIREGGGASRGTGRSIWRRALVVAQIALLTVLGVSAALLVRSSYHINESHWGYDARPVFIGKLDMRREDFPKPEQRLLAFHRIVDELERLPGIRAAAVMVNPIGYSSPSNCSYALDPAAFAARRPLGATLSSEVSEDILKTIGVSLVEGSPLTRDMNSAGPTYAIINQSLAARLWPGKDPLGRAIQVRFVWQDPKDPPLTVLVHGIVRNFQASGPMTQENDTLYINFTDWVPPNIFILARGDRLPPSAETVRRVVNGVDSRIAMYFPSSLTQQIDMTLSSVRLTAMITFVYAIAAILLCAIGVYSLTVAQIVQRSREFGIRMALGVEPTGLWIRFTRNHLFTSLVGLAVGAIVASQTTRVLSSLLFGVGQHDVPTFAGVALAIVLISAAACVPSLFRLRRINPSDCLRSL